MRCVHCRHPGADKPYGLCKNCYFTKEIVREYRRSAKNTVTSDGPNVENSPKVPITPDDFLGRHSEDNEIDPNIVVSDSSVSKGTVANITRAWVIDKLKEFFCAEKRQPTVMLIPNSLWQYMQQWPSDEWGGGKLAEEIANGCKPKELFGCRVYYGASTFALA